MENNVNEPPKYVILDDRSAYECFASKIPRQYLKQYWNHDFGGTGVVRARRSHRGRGSVGDKDAKGDDKYNFTRLGKGGGDKYHFTGEKEYTPIIYRTSDVKLSIAAFKPAKRGLPSAPPKKELPSNKHGHNQFTPKDQMVKYGAAHKGSSHLRYRPRVNTFLPRDKSPLSVGRKTGRSALTALDPMEAMELPNAVLQRRTLAPSGDGAAIFVDDEDEPDGNEGPPVKKMKTRGRTDSIVELGTDDGEEEGEALPDGVEQPSDLNSGQGLLPGGTKDELLPRLSNLPSQSLGSGGDVEMAAGSSHLDGDKKDADLYSARLRLEGKLVAARSHIRFGQVELARLEALKADLQHKQSKS